jgi:hypothetical protein
MLEVFFYFKKQKFSWKFARFARGCRELDHTQYELEWWAQIISISENFGLVKLSGKNNFNFARGNLFKHSK